MQRHADEHQASGPTRHMKYAAALRLKNADVFLLHSVILMNRSAASHAQRKAEILLVKFYSFLRHLYLRPHVQLASSGIELHTWLNPPPPDPGAVSYVSAKQFYSASASLLLLLLLHRCCVRFIHLIHSLSGAGVRGAGSPGGEETSRLTCAGTQPLFPPHHRLVSSALHAG